MKIASAASQEPYAFLESMVWDASESGWANWPDPTVISAARILAAPIWRRAAGAARCLLDPGANLREAWLLATDLPQGANLPRPDLAEYPDLQGTPVLTGSHGQRGLR